MNSQEVMRELEELQISGHEIAPDEVFQIVNKLNNEKLRNKILQQLISRGIASSSRQAKSWRHLTTKTSISTAIREIRNYKEE